MAPKKFRTRTFWRSADAEVPQPFVRQNVDQIGNFDKDGKVDKDGNVDRHRNGMRDQNVKQAEKVDEDQNVDKAEKVDKDVIFRPFSRTSNGRDSQRGFVRCRENQKSPFRDVLSAEVILKHLSFERALFSALLLYLVSLTDKKVNTKQIL
jgi:hypothetical protein